MIPDELRSLPDHAAAQGLGPVSIVASTGSTNADLKRLAKAGAVDGTVLIADAQSGGKGRLGRVWESPAGSNLYLSLLLRPRLPLAKVPLLCLGAAAVLAEVAGTPLHIKWPNDLLAPDGRKVAGLLAEADQRQGVLQWVVLGIGVNVRAAPTSVPAVSLLELGGEAQRDRLALGLLRGLRALPDEVASRPGDLLNRWRAHAAMLGQRVSVAGHTGRAVDVDEDGALILMTPSGRKRILAGDVEMIG